MVALWRFHLLPLIFAGFTVLATDAYLRKYIPLIIGLHDHYGPSRVYIVMPYFFDHKLENTMSFVLTRELSRNGIFSFIIHSESSVKNLNRREKRGARPIVVVVLTAFEDIQRFIKYRKSYNISYPMWLMIFTDEFGGPICGFCKKPNNNFLGLLFDTQMVIVCCNDSSLQEWWSDHRNRTERVPIGEWTVEDGLKRITNQSLYTRRSEVHGVGFRIGIVTNSAFYIEEDGKPGGFFNSILWELARVMDFNKTRILRREGFGSWDTEADNWSGVIGLLDQNQVDLGVAEFSMTTRRLEVVDFTLPLMVTPIQLYFKAVDDSGVQWSAHFKAFALQIWMTIILLVITSSILVAVMKMGAGGNSFKNLISEHYLYVWGIFCQQGLAVFPSESSLRIAYCSIFVSALVVSAAYSASLISFITVSTTSVPFDNLEDFANDGTYDLIVLKHSADWDLFYQASADPVIKKMKQLLRPWDQLPRNMKESFDEICKGKVAFYSSAAMVQTGMNHLPCKISRIDTGSIDSFALILKTGSQYTEVINYHIQRFEDNGMLNRLKEKYMTIPSEPEALPNEVTLWGVVPIFSVLAGGIVVSLIVLCCEKMYAAFGKLRLKWRRSRESGSTYSRKPTIPRGFNKTQRTWHSQSFFEARYEGSRDRRMGYNP